MIKYSSVGIDLYNYAQSQSDPKSAPMGAGRATALRALQTAYVSPVRIGVRKGMGPS